MEVTGPLNPPVQGPRGGLPLIGGPTPSGQVLEIPGPGAPSFFQTFFGLPFPADLVPKIHAKKHQKSIQKTIKKSIDFSIEFWSQNWSKTHLKKDGKNNTNTANNSNRPSKIPIDNIHFDRSGIAL